MKKSLRLRAILLALVTVLSVLPMSALAANSSFTDVPENAWFYKPVTYMAENGYMSGTSGSKFSPHQTTTRAMFVTVLGRIAGVDQSQYKNTCTFRDVKKD
ncbi:S-layer homology domain-containing protein [Acutalibacter muris]|uniref:S-layer homology domain-containing protein n=1 Tax=Acutalibacter muris TaxID=1796620 RepID=UPI00272E3D20|nr:S-layer homology domain-containing protein [Acutalibacter muris]